MTRLPSPHRRIAPALCALLLLVGALAVASPALAQNTDTIDISVDHGFSSVASSETLVANIRDCRDEVGDDWTFTITFNQNNYNDSGTRPEYALKIETESGACSADIAQDTDTCRLVKTPVTIPSTFQVQWETTFNAFAGIDSREACLDLSGTISLVVVSTLVTGTGDDDEGDGDPITDRYAVNFRTTRPDAPTGLSVTAGEDNLRVAFTAPEDAPTDATYNVYVSANPDLLAAGASPEEAEDSGARRVTGSASQTIAVDSGLSVDTTYTIAVVTVDEDGNESLLSETTTATTTPTLDFYELYRDAGGADEGGLLCATAQPGRSAAPGALGLLGGLGLLGVALAWRRRRAARALGAGAALALALTAGAAQADAQDLSRLQGETSGTFELRVGTYLPEVDSAFSGDGPYKQIFKDESMLLVEAEFERILWHGVGTLGVGVDFGFMQAVGKGLDVQGNTSVDTTVFNIIPLRVGAIYRFDLLTRELGIPLVPVLKAGLDYYIWWITNGAGDVAEFEGGGEGFGGTAGWHVAPALHLHLDGFSPRSANNLDFDFGIKNTYLFAEYLITQVDDFGSSSSIVLSDSALMFGLAFDY